jgi:hypothetical protein
MSTTELARKIQAVAKRTATVGALSSYLRPRLAMDAQLDVATIFKGVTGKNFGAKKGAIAERIRAQSKDKLAKDANLNDVEKVLDMLEKHEVNEGTDQEVTDPEHKAIGAATQGAILPVDNKPKGFDAEAVKKFCADRGMSTDDIAELSGMFPKPATDAEVDEDDEETKKKKAAEAAAAKDKDMDEKKDMVTKPAMDAAIAEAKAVTKKEVTAEVRATEHNIRMALDAIEPWVGKLPSSMAFDSAAGVYRQALTMLGVEGAKDPKKLHDDALLPILRAQPRPGTRSHDTPIAMDASTVEGFAKRFPEANRIGHA